VSVADEQSNVRIPLVEERLVTEKRRIETGKVRVRTLVEEERQVVRERLARSHVEVERVPMDIEVDEVPPVREEDGVTIVPVVREVLVLTKKLILTEEVRLKRVTGFEDHAEPVTLRVQRAVVEREELSGEQQP
jgi:stress response protein YsnF